MKTTFLLTLAALLTLLANSSPVGAQTTAFTYNGLLTEVDSPATGLYEMRFTLYDAVTDGNAVGTPFALTSVPVTNGLFTVSLDFGASVFTGTDRWLEIAVRPNGGSSFTNIAQRQPITPTPYALHAYNAAGLMSFANAPLDIKVNGLRALRLEYTGDSASDPGTTPDGAPNLIGGSPRNFVGAGVVGATIGGGGATNYGGFSYTNSVLSDFGVVSGGRGNRIAADSFYATIAGGSVNDIATSAFASAIGGGNNNTIAANAESATIAGGVLNDIGTNSDYSAIGGGFNNNIAANSVYATIAGGVFNDIGTNSDYSAIGGGNDNNIAANAESATIAGGVLNDIGTNSDYSAIGGGGNNNILANSFYATIAGGSGNDIGTNSISSAIGGGTNNTIAANSFYATIAGGSGNDIGTNSISSAIGGGADNTIAANSSYATIAGGVGNDIGTNSENATIGGGGRNRIQTNAEYATIGGGVRNRIQTEADSATIGGGDDNEIQTNADYATIGGGRVNIISNDVQAATIPGGERNSVGGDYGFAAGQRAKANHQGAFVWADYSSFDFASTAVNQFNVRAVGGVRIVTGIDDGGDPDAGVTLNPNDSSWNVISDRSAKKNFRPADGREILERLARLPIQHWNYKWETDAAVPHLGPTAQDFKAAFYPGRDDKTISTLEADGVALAAIQGLNQKVEQEERALRKELRAKDTRISALEKELAALKALVEKLSTRE